MKNISLIIFALTTIVLTSNAQQFITKSGNITFYSDGPLEKIEARNNQVNSALNTKTGDFVFKVLMKSFVFEKALMQEHFNENYVESDKYPVAIFKGKITNITSEGFSKLGDHDANIEGELTIRGIAHNIEATGVFKVEKNTIVGTSKLYIKLADYDISIPGAVTGKIAEEIEISVNINLKPLKK